VPLQRGAAEVAAAAAFVAMKAKQDKVGLYELSTQCI
jgi:hypothetical protein